MELGRRRQLSDGLDTPFIKRSKDAANIFMPLLQDKTHECTCVIYLNTASKVIKYELMNNGGLTSSIVDVRLILKNALLFGASQIVLGHNHPSGNKQASAQDKALTIKLRDAAHLLDIKLLDHIIIAGSDFLSLSDEGYM
jgi:DNA repair protein RadC